MIPASLSLKCAGNPASGFTIYYYNRKILNGDMPITDLTFN